VLFLIITTGLLLYAIVRPYIQGWLAVWPHNTSLTTRKHRLKGKDGGRRQHQLNTRRYQHRSYMANSCIFLIFYILVSRYSSRCYRQSYHETRQGQYPTTACRPTILALPLAFPLLPLLLLLLPLPLFPNVLPLVNGK